jgi:CBS domain-containing protein
LVHLIFMEQLLFNRTHEFGRVDGGFLTQPLEVLEPSPPISVDGSTTIAQCVLLMQRHRIGALLITDTSGALMGIFSERDYLLRVVNSGINPESTPITRVMTGNPHAERLETSIAFALHLMGEGGYRHLPLVDEEEHPIGMISVRDIIGFIQQELLRQLVQRESVSEVQS